MAQKTKVTKPKTKRQPRRRTRTTTVAPKAVIVRQSKPVFQSRGQHTIVKHKERFATVTRTGGDTGTRRLVINPGSSSLFPWLSQIAPNYETYLFHKLTFHFETDTSTITGGSFTMAVDYDPDDYNTYSQEQLDSFKKAVSGTIYRSGSMKSDISDLRKRKTYYVREKTQTIGQIADRSSDIGIFYFIMTDSLNAAGRLYVEYEIEFQTPQVTIARTPTFTAAEVTIPNEINQAMDKYTVGDFQIVRRGASVLNHTGQGVRSILGMEYLPSFTPSPFTREEDVSGSLTQGPDQEDAIEITTPGVYEMLVRQQRTALDSHLSLTPAQISEFMSEGGGAVIAPTAGARDNFFLNSDNASWSAFGSGDNVLVTRIVFTLAAATTLFVRFANRMVISSTTSPSRTFSSQATGLSFNLQRVSQTVTALQTILPYAVRLWSQYNSSPPLRFNPILVNSDEFEVVPDKVR